MPGAVTDVELVDQALTGSQSAYAELARRYAGPAVNLAARMVQDRALAEDLAQEAFARAFARLGSYDRQHKFSSWFFRVLHNVTVDHLRRRRVKTSSLDEMAEGGSPLTPIARGAGPDAQAEQRALGLALEDAIGRLRPEYREVVVLRYREDLPVQEIAEITNLPVGTVKTYLFRARKELAAILEPQGWGESRASSAETARGTNP